MMNVELQGSVRLKKFWIAVAAALKTLCEPDEATGLAECTWAMDWTIVIRPEIKDDRYVPPEEFWKGCDPETKRAVYAVPFYDEDDWEQVAAAESARETAEALEALRTPEDSDLPEDSDPTPLEYAQEMLWMLSVAIDVHQGEAFGDV